jgi:hypothetical protein
MHEFNIKPESHNVFFGQLFGMCDFISFILGEHFAELYI